MRGALKVRVGGRGLLVRQLILQNPASGEAIRTKARFLVSTTSCFRERTDAGPQSGQRKQTWFGNTGKDPWLNVHGAGGRGGPQAPRWTMVEASCGLLSLGCQVLHFTRSQMTTNTPACYFCPKAECFSYSRAHHYLPLPPLNDKPKCLQTQPHAPRGWQGHPRWRTIDLRWGTN